MNDIISNSSTRFFCTLFDKNYLVKGSAMIRSLSRNCRNCVIYVLCLDEVAQTFVDSLGLPFVITCSLNEINDIDLDALRLGRTRAEFCWTLSSVFTWFVINEYEEIDLLTYLDADIYFYSSIQPLFDEIGDASISIIEHRFSPRLSHLIVNGRFCVEWCSFRRDYEGMACLKKWRDQCIEWCFYRLEDGKMGDQKYLDSWPSDFDSCHIIRHPGAGIAPWNYTQYSFSCDELSSLICVNHYPLIFYHFHQFQILSAFTFSRLSSYYTLECKEPHMVYLEYEKEIAAVINEFRRIDNSFRHGFSGYGLLFRRLSQEYLPLSLKRFFRFLFGLLGRSG